jgi:tetratricopeptide (TPR) repeat protein
VCPWPGFHSLRVSALIGALVLACTPLAAQRTGRTGAQERTYSVRGRVLDAEKQAPLERASVELRSLGGGTFGTMLTRDAGDFEFASVPEGHYEIRVQQAGYHTVTEQLDVHGSVLGLSVELHPNSSTATPTPGPASVSARELAIPQNARDAMAKGLMLLYGKSSYQKSVKQFQRAIHDYPEYYEAYTQVGVANLYLGKSANAEEALRKAVELSHGQDAVALSWLATLLNDRRRFTDAEPLARKGVELDSNSWQANAELARSLIGLQRPAEAEKSALAASKLQPDNPLIYLVLANIHGELENGPALLEDLSNYLRLNPTGTVADKVRAQKKKLEDEIREARQTAPPPAQEPAPAPINANVDTPYAAVPKFEDSPALNSNKPVLWPPTNVDASVPPVEPGAPCPLDKILKGTRQRVKELLENVDRFTATEVVDYDEIGRDGRSIRSLQYNFDYLADFSLGRDGDLRFEESRTENGKSKTTPLPIRTVGLAVGAAVFHPLRVDDFEMACEGLGQWHAKAAWQLRFEQRPDRQPRFQAVFSDGHWYDVKLKGRAWISPESSQIEHIDFDLLETIPRIRLQTEHMSLDYRAVDFPKRRIQLWLPQTVSFYLDIDGHRFLNHHELSNYILFAVDTNQQIQPPRESK